MREVRKKKTGLARASGYVYTLLLMIFIAVQIVYEVRRGQFWDDNLAEETKVSVARYHDQIQVGYFTWIIGIAVVTILWAIAASISKRKQKNT
ncbi:hypothetical protein [Tumebacillus flagellatus]|uniref:Uncharacterized protein n=1 Tax=Tumebacillus flagellatus TaxID=1157490 RepID=A0A074LP39_9BACL|nr:hypothetical protein [Tumebacillus flagellatus]KEO82869.1 hypothetical protein EL26_13255 [Tumebacillus flagellatus]